MLLLKFLIASLAYSSAFSLTTRAADDAASDAASSIVDLGYTKYQGALNAETGNTQFLGIRFAAPPIGNLRWRAPQAPSPTPGVQQANAQPNACFQASNGNAPLSPYRLNNSTAIQNRSSGLEKRAGLSVSEDCLFLNVYVPGTLVNKKSLPVVVWIHGGGYISGSASGYQGTDFFDGNDLIREASGGVVAVIIQYRLGVFGFLPGAKVKADGALNAGLLDQQFALRWVQQNIEKFGGDPAKVTIWGQSAGAGSVLQQVIANDGKTTPPLFRGVITSSIFLPSQYQFDDPIPEKLYSETIAQTNCTGAPNTLSCLRSVDANTLQAANTEINSNGFFGTFVFVPVVDGTFITERPTQLLSQGKVNGQVLMVVSNTFEGATFVDSSTALKLQLPNYASQLFPEFGSREIAAATAQYQSLGTPIFDAIAMMGESLFICPTYSLLRAFNGLSFKGEFAIPPGYHGDDVGYYFPTQNINSVPQFNNTAFDKAFSESFLNFVMALDPNVKSDSSDITPQWNKWNGRVEMLFNKTEAGAPVVQSTSTSDALLQRCNFWQSVAALSGH